MFTRSTFFQAKMRPLLSFPWSRRLKKIIEHRTFTNKVKQTNKKHPKKLKKWILHVTLAGLHGWVSSWTLQCICVYDHPVEMLFLEWGPRLWFSQVSQLMLKMLVSGPHLHGLSPCLLVYHQSIHPDRLFQFPWIPWKDTQVPKMKCLAEFQVQLQERQTLCYEEKSLTSCCFWSFPLSETICFTLVYSKESLERLFQKQRCTSSVINLDFHSKEKKQRYCYHLKLHKNFKM